MMKSYVKGELQNNWQYVSNYFRFSYILNLIHPFLLITIIKEETSFITLLELIMNVGIARKYVQIVFSKLLCAYSLTIRGLTHSYLPVVQCSPCQLFVLLLSLVEPHRKFVSLCLLDIVLPICRKTLLGIETKHVALNIKVNCRKCKYYADNIVAHAAYINRFEISFSAN